jgi:hypothetical protein
VPKLSDRMLRADTLADGRLLRVSPSARLLAVVLEALAEPTGVLKPDEDEIRSVAPFYLANASGKPPTTAQIEKWTAELVASKWAVEYEREGVRLLYLKGFGTRQQGANVCLGISATTGEIAPHLPLPACIRDLKAHVERGSAANPRKVLPVHCETDYSLCPCELLKPSPTVPEPYAMGEEKEVDLKGVDLKRTYAKELDGEENPRGGTDPAASILKRLEHAGIAPKDVDAKVTAWRTTYRDDDITAAVERTETAPTDTFLSRVAASILTGQQARSVK